MRLVLISSSVGLIVALLGTPLLISFLRKHGYAQAIRVSSADEPYPEHEGKRGTPSMGGLAILAGLILIPAERQLAEELGVAYLGRRFIDRRRPLPDPSFCDLS